MRIPTLYLDTSVLGGYHDTERMTETRLLWQQARAGQWRLVTSKRTPWEIQQWSAFQTVEKLAVL